MRVFLQSIHKIAILASSWIAVTCLATAAPLPIADDSSAKPDPIADLERLYGDLFGKEVGFDQAEYFLATPVQGVGYYEGWNESGQPFTLSVSEYEKVDFSELAESDPESYALMMASNSSNATVTAKLSTGLHTELVTGQAMSLESPWKGTESYFFPVATSEGVQLEPALPGFWEHPLTKEPLPEPKQQDDCFVVEWDSWYVYHSPLTANHPDADACRAAYGAAMAGAKQAFEAAMQQANNKRAQDTAAENASFASDLRGLRSAFQAALVGCRLLDPASGALCYQLARRAHVQLSLQRAEQNIDRIDQIESEYEASVAAAEAALEAARAAAQADLIACLEAAGFSGICRTKWSIMALYCPSEYGVPLPVGTYLSFGETECP